MARSIVAQIAELDGMPMDGLRAKWLALFEGDPPQNNNRKQLITRIAYRLQELTFGGLSKEARDKLENIADAENERINGKRLIDKSHKAIPGTLYIREWQGQRIEVTALESGFEWEGNVYRSLSAIATRVTGTKWNGKQFFGLVQKKKRKTDA